MAKLAQVGYGSDGRGTGKSAEGYTYVVNDNVRTGDVIQVIATSRAGRKFATTGSPLHTYKETSVKGKLAKQNALTNLAEKGQPQELTRSYTGKELEVSAKRTKTENMQSEYTQKTREGNIQKYREAHPDAEFVGDRETFDSYSKKYMQTGGDN